ncbi:uncharacterized protein LOC124167501 [Ischnura elegans]|uniref:uncharacterized protein LOC124167501 n=1 Tax=Ischnura elegans TaxID=197161 RepID=UPI001ED8A222|nr:uncharacterized protein LOC124167501 [Ischnura elegans]
MSADDLAKIVDREHLQRALVKLSGSDNVQLTRDIQVESGTTSFAGFLSVVLRVKVSFIIPDDPKPREKSLFVKCLPREKFQQDLVKELNVFHRESVYYGSVLPLLERAAGGRLDVPIPKCYHTYSDGSNDVLYLEDLVESGFGMAGDNCRNDGLDGEHSLLVARKLGVLHALTMAAERILPSGKRTWAEATPSLGRDALYYDVPPGEKPAPFKGVADTGNEIVVEVAAKLPGLPKLAADSGRLRKIILRFWSITAELLKPNAKGRNVLCHGDAWANNFMFTYKPDGAGRMKPHDMKFVDLQLAKYCHPAVDLLFYMYLGVGDAYRRKFYDAIVREYYESLRNSLSVLEYGSPPFSFEEFRSDVNEIYRPFAVYLRAVFTPCMQLGEDFMPKNVEDMTPELFQEIVKTGNVAAIRRHLESDPPYRCKVEAAVKEFVEVVFPDGSIDSSPFLI